MTWLAILLLSAAQADDRTDQTYAAHAADAGTTALALMSGAGAELNPMAGPLFPITLYITHREGGKACSRLNGEFRAVRYAASANNLLVILGAGAIAPIGLLVGYPLWIQARNDHRDCQVQVLKEVLQL